MDIVGKQYDNVGEAIRAINSLIKNVKNLNILDENVGEHLNPGDVYDAYIEIGRTPVVEDVLEAHRCGPFAAIFLQRRYGQCGRLLNRARLDDESTPGGPFFEYIPEKGKNNCAKSHLTCSKPQCS